MTPEQINHILGNIDLYLLDQILKGRISPNMKILDAGCGEGRNLHYFIHHGYTHLFGVDQNPTAIRMLRMLAKNIPEAHFSTTCIEEMVFPPSAFDYVICNAVLHFAKNHEHFEKQLSCLIEVLKPHGHLFIRMTSDHYMSSAKALQDGRYVLPDGSTRYLLSIDQVPELMKKFKLSFVEPLKSLHVHDQRTMTTLILRKEL